MLLSSSPSLSTSRSAQLLQNGLVSQLCLSREGGREGGKKGGRKGRRKGGREGGQKGGWISVLPTDDREVASVPHCVGQWFILSVSL